MLFGDGATLDKEKILVVDDEEAIREVVSTLLEAQGYQTHGVLERPHRLSRVSATTRSTWCSATSSCPKWTG